MKNLTNTILAAAPNILAAAGLILYFSNQGKVPQSLTVALGPFADAFAVLLVLSMVASGLLSVPRFPYLLYAEAAIRPLAAATMMSYAVAVAFSATPAWITTGFAAALAADQLGRWRYLATVLIPEARQLRQQAELVAEMREERRDAH